MDRRMEALEIMLPYYGPPDLMKATVNSVLEQTDPCWTLTVVDDGYPDPSVARWFAQLKDSRILYVRNEKNLGANGNYRRCVELLSGEYCVILGADDLLLPNYVESVRAAINRFPQVAIVQPGVKIIDENGASRRSLVDSAKKRLYMPRVSDSHLFSGEQIAVSLIRGNWLYFPSLAWRVQSVKKHDFQPGFDVVQDLALVMDIIRDGGQLLVERSTCFLYRRHRASDSSIRALDGSRFLEERRFFLAEAERLDVMGWRSAAKEARRHVSSRLHAATLIPAALRCGNTRGARTLTRYALQSQ